MAARQSAGLLLYRWRNELEVFLVHPGGPYWTNRDDGAWSIPKGEFLDSDDPLEAAKRELEEEAGLTVDGDFAPLDPVKQPGGKTVHAWMVEADADPEALRSNLFEIEWPPRSGRMQRFPEVDRAAWFTVDEAREKILKGQRPLLEQVSTRAKSAK